MSSVGGVWGRGRHVGLEVESLVNNGIACVQEKVGGDLKGTELERRGWYVGISYR